MAARPPLPRGLALGIAFTASSLSAATGVGAQQEDFVAVVQQDGASMIARLVGCGPACMVMRFDDGVGQTMFIDVRMFEGGVMDGHFSFVNHGDRAVDVLPFSDPALADYVFGAQAAQPGQTGNFFQDLVSSLFSTSNVTPTGEWETFAVENLESGETLELEAERHTFEFQYEMEMLPGLAQMTPEQRQQMPDIKLGMTMEGETWVAPGAPGAAQVSRFYAAMGAAMKQFVLSLSGEEGQQGQQADMTAAMVAAMAAIAEKGLPLRTRTKMEMKPVVGGAGGAMAAMIVKMIPVPDLADSTSEVTGLGLGEVARGPLPSGYPATMNWGWGAGWSADAAYDPEGYQVRHIAAAGAGGGASH